MPGIHCVDTKNISSFYVCIFGCILHVFTMCFFWFPSRKTLKLRMGKRRNSSRANSVISWRNSKPKRQRRLWYAFYSYQNQHAFYEWISFSFILFFYMACIKCTFQYLNLFSSIYYTLCSWSGLWWAEVLSESTMSIGWGHTPWR